MKNEIIRREEINKAISKDLGGIYNSCSPWQKAGLVGAIASGYLIWKFGPIWYKERQARTTTQVKEEEARKTTQVKGEEARKTLIEKARLEEEKSQRDHERWLERQGVKIHTGMKATGTAPVAPTTPYCTQAATGPSELCNKDGLVGALFPRNETTSVAAPTGVGKSRFIHQALFRLSGVDVPKLHSGDTPRTTPIPCFLYDNELGKEGFGYRYRNSGLNFNGKPFHYHDLTGDTSQEALFAAIKADINATDDEVVIAIDCMYKIDGFKDKPENIYRRLNQLRCQHNARTGKAFTVIPIFHTNECTASPNKSLNSSDIKGSQDFARDSKQILLMNKCQIKGCIRITVAKNTYGKVPENEFLYRSTSDVLFEYMGDYASEVINRLEHPVSWEEFQQMQDTPAPQEGTDRTQEPKPRRGRKGMVDDKGYKKYLELCKTMSREDAAQKSCKCSLKTIRNYEKQLKRQKEQ